MKKKISIIVPCYNVESYLERCVLSLVRQTIGLEALELIFVNDASQDNTWEVLKEYEKRYPEHIVLVDLPENVKQGGARNIGLQYASSDYIGFVDADDWVEASMFEKLYQRANEYDCDMVCCKYMRVAEPVEMGRTGKVDRLCVISSVQQLKEAMLEGVEGGICCNIYRRSIIFDNQIFFPEGMFYEDNFWLPMLQLYIRRYYIIEEYLYNYYFNRNSTITKRDSLHHLDRMVIELMKLEEFEKKGIYELLQDEIELRFLKLFFINTLHILFTRFSTIPKGVFELMQATVLERFPNYKKNPYIEERLNGVAKALLPLVEMEVSPENLEMIASQYRKAF